MTSATPWRRGTVATAVVLTALASAPPMLAQNPNWTRPFPGHRVIANLYAVGTYDLGVFLITTGDGHILINTGLEDSTSLIRENVESLGFRLEDVEILLTMQAHWDHTAAMAEIREIADAQVWATAGRREGNSRTGASATHTLAGASRSDL